jgi:hypothetical protein
MTQKSRGLSDIVRQTAQKTKVGQGPDVRDPSALPHIFNILDYIYQDWGLKMKLFPVQKFIVKLYYGLELDEDIPENPHERIVITDMEKTRVLYTFSEQEYLHFLFNEGRCNVDNQDTMRRELALSIGRRGGKTLLSGIFASYEVYRLLNMNNPQAYYGFPEGNVIQILSIATRAEQSKLIFNEVNAHLSHCSYFQPYLVSSTTSDAKFQTPHDVELFGDRFRQDDGKFVSQNGRYSLRITFSSCIAKGLRGFSNIVVILDEVAHFTGEGSSSAEDVYEAVTPSMATFSRKDPTTRLPLIDPETGEEAPVESRMIMISSPLGKSGKFYERFDQAFKGGNAAKNILAIQAPTWEVNPTIPAAYYAQKFHENPVSFMVEHGAEFNDQMRGWIERQEDLLACIDLGMRPKMMAPPRLPHQMGVDVGIVNDGTAVFITHPEEDKVVLDYHEVWYAGVDWREANPHLTEPVIAYARGLADVQVIEFEEIANWIEALSKRFFISSGLFDQWNGKPLEQHLHKRGLKQFQSEFFTRDVSSKMYQVVKSFMYDKKLALYDYPLPSAGNVNNTKHSPFIAELFSLEANQLSKNITLVQKPKRSGAKDDMSDAYVRAAWQTIELVTNQKFTCSGSSHRPYASTPIDATRYQSIRARHHGSSPRSVPRLGGRLVRGR